MMKRMFYMLLAILVLSACKKEEKPVDYTPAVIGEWHCAAIGLDSDVYVSFTEDKKFSLYQKMGDTDYKFYSGFWDVQQDTLTGSYADGTDWGSSYRLEFIDNDTMVMTALNGSDDIVTYVRETIPNEVKVIHPSLLMLNSQPQYRWL